MSGHQKHPCSAVRISFLLLESRHLCSGIEKLIFKCADVDSLLRWLQYVAIHIQAASPGPDARHVPLTEVPRFFIISHPTLAYLSCHVQASASREEGYVAEIQQISAALAASEEACRVSSILVST